MRSRTTTHDLIATIRDGNQEAFAALFERYRNKLLVLIRYRMSRRLQEKMEVEDLLQETFLRAARDFDGFEYRGPGSFLRWLLQIARHVTADAARFHGRKARQGPTIPFRSPSNPSGPEPVDSLTPGRCLEEKERLEALVHLLGSLPEHYRQVLLLSKVEGWTTAEIAEQLGKSRTEIALLLHRAVKRFRKLRGREGDR